MLILIISLLAAVGGIYYYSINSKKQNITNTPIQSSTPAPNTAPTETEAPTGN